MKYLFCSVLLAGVAIGCGIKVDGLPAPGDAGDGDETLTAGVDARAARKDAFTRKDAEPSRLDAPSVVPASDSRPTPTEDGPGTVPPDARVERDSPGAVLDSGPAADALAAADTRVADTRPSVDAPAGPDVRPLPDATGPKIDGPDRPARALLATNTEMLTSGDIALRTRLSALGFPVRVAAAHNAEGVRAIRQLAPGYDLIVISHSYDSTVPESPTLAELKVPIICMEVLMFPHLRMVPVRADGQGWLAAQTQITITKPSHQLAAELPAGALTVVPGAALIGWGRPLPSATVVATTADSAEQATIFAYETKAAVTQGQAPARRVGWFGNAETIPSFNATAWSLFDAAVNWAAGITSF